MSLADWADVATITVSILAVLGIGWLVVVRIRRHRRFQEDYEFLCTQIKASVKLNNELAEALTAFTQQLPESGRVELLIALIGQHLDYMSSQLTNLQFIGLADFFRQHDADEEVASLLADWKLRSPITRRE